MKNFQTAQSDRADAVAAVSSIKEQLSDIDAGMVLYFAAPSYPPAVISQTMANVFAGARTVGCTTAGEMGPCKIGQNTIVAMAWSRASLKGLHIEILENIQTDTEAVAKAFQSFEKQLGKSAKDWDPSRYAGIVLIDGLSLCEEKLNDQLGNLTNVPFVGGSAGDNYMQQNTWIFADGKAYTNAAALVLTEPANGYSILKTQSFTATDKKLIPTEVDEARRRVIRFNGKPAAEAYAEVLGITPDELAKSIGNYSLGLVFDRQNFFVRSAMKVEDTSAITFYCMVKEGLELTVLQQGDIVAETRVALQRCGETQAVIDFNCCLRFAELQRNAQLEAYSKVFDTTPAIGFATYGESYIGHMNMTSTMLLLK